MGGAKSLEPAGEVLGGGVVGRAVGAAADAEDGEAAAGEEEGADAEVVGTLGEPSGEEGGVGRGVAVFPGGGDEEDEGFLGEILGLVLSGVEQVQVEAVGGEEGGEAEGEGFGGARLGGEEELAPARRSGGGDDAAAASEAVGTVEAEGGGGGEEGEEGYAGGDGEVGGSHQWRTYTLPRLMVAAPGIANLRPSNDDRETEAVDANQVRNQTLRFRLRL